MPRILCDILKETVGRHADMEVVGEQPAGADLVAAARAALADVVVVAPAEPELPAECGALLAAIPGMRVVGVAADGRHAFLWELGPPLRQVSLGEVSPKGLVQAIRSAVRVRSA